MKLYVGTYGKYAEGSLKGAWLDLANYANADEFLAACRKLHRDEAEPEIMFQDCETSEDWEAGLYSEHSVPREWWTIKAGEDAKKRAEDAEEAGAAAGVTVTVTENREKHGIEIRFAARPADEILKSLKTAGWRWSRFGGCWYNRASDEARTFAAQISGSEIAATVTAKTTNTVIKDADKAEARADKAEQARLMGKYLAIIEQTEGKHWIDYYKKNAARIVELENGSLMAIEKPKIETRFCHGENDRGQGGEGPGTIAFAEKQCAHDETKEGFLHNNFAKYTKFIVREIGRKVLREEVFTRTEKLVPTAALRYENGIANLECRYNGMWDSDVKGEAITPEDARRIRHGFMMVRADYKRRLETWWRRFGAEYIHTWTYWTEA